MVGLAVGLSLQPWRAPQTTAPIVAWGDSLTQGAGSTGGQTYPAQAQALLGPERVIVNRGVGGQDATSIAARQGGVPTLVSVEDDVIPAREPLVRSWTFVAGTLDGAVYQGNHAPTGSAGVVDGKAVIQAPSYLQGLRFPLGVDLPSGTPIAVTLDLTVPVGMVIRVGGFRDGEVLWAANNGSGFDGQLLSTSGSHSFTLFAGSLNPSSPQTMNELVVLTDDTPGGATTFTIDNLTISAPAPEVTVAITGSSVTPLVPESALDGTLADVGGALLADSEGALRFQRDDEGAMVSVPADTPFLPIDSVALAGHTHWIWVGNNGVMGPEDIAIATAAVAGMIEQLQHSRYLVLSALPRPDRVASITGFNTALAETHGLHFVDVLEALQAAGDGTPDDAADIASGLVPRSLRVDDIHLTNAGYGVVAAAVVAAMEFRGW